MNYLATVADQKDGHYADSTAFETLEAAKQWVADHDTMVPTDNNGGKTSAHYYEIHKGEFTWDAEEECFGGIGTVIEEGEI